MLELVRVKRWLPGLQGGPGRPRLSRAALARAVFDLPTTRALRERLEVDATLRRLCGRERIDGIPSEATFSWAFAEFAESDLPTCLHEALVRAHLEGHVMGHIALDSTAIPVRERRQRKADQEQGETQPGREQERLGERQGKRAAAQPARAGPSRLERQRSMMLEKMLADLPTQCDKGAKKNAQGYKETPYGIHLQRCNVYLLHTKRALNPHAMYDRWSRGSARQRASIACRARTATARPSITTGVGGWISHLSSFETLPLSHLRSLFRLAHV